MDMKTIIEMAKEAGLIVDANQSGFDSVEAFDKRIRDDEKEACAKVCDELLKEDGNWTPTGHRFAAAIRARS